MAEITGLIPGYTIHGHGFDEIHNPFSIFSIEAPGSVKEGEIRYINRCLWYASLIDTVEKERPWPISWIFGHKRLGDKIWWRKVPSKQSKDIEDLQDRLGAIEKQRQQPAPWTTRDEVWEIVKLMADQTEDSVLSKVGVNKQAITAVELEDFMQYHLKHFKHKEYKDA